MESRRPRYTVDCSGAIAKTLKSLQQQAAEDGRGPHLLAAFRQIIDHLRSEPSHAGEPLYRLPALRLDVRCIVVRPLALDYAVSEEARLVFIKAARLLSK